MKRMMIPCVILALILSFIPAAAGFADTSFENRASAGAPEQTEAGADAEGQTAQPGDAAVQGNDSEAQAAAPEGQAAQPEDAAVQTTDPEEQTAQPEEQTTDPEVQTAQPEEQTTAPEVQTAQPEEQATAPEVQTAQPEEQIPAPEIQTEAPEAFADMPYIPGSLMQITASGAKCAAILNALDNRLYNHTLEQLVNTESAEAGSRNDVVESIQETLRDFGAEVEVDGRYSDRLMNAFNGVFSSFKLDRVKKIDADSYARLLGIMLIKEDPDKALEIIFPGRDPQKDKGLPGYLQGCVNMAQEKYYSAKSDFKSSRYDDYKTRLKECEIPEPANGVIWENPDLFDPYTSLEIILTNDDQNRDIYIEIYTPEGVLQSRLYLTGSGSVWTNLAAGTYVIKIAYGTLWYGEKEVFGKSGNYGYIYFEEGDAFGDGYEITFDAGFEYQVNVYVTDSFLGGPADTWENWVNGLPEEFPAAD